MEDFFKEHIKQLYTPLETFPWDNRFVYAQFLAQTYYYVSHSTRLLAVSASRFSRDEEDLHRRFIKHMSEEKGHHLIAQFDLKNLGFSLDSFPELPMTKAFYECQYFKCGYLDPIALFGYILALEGIAVTQGPSIHERVLESFGERATGFVRLHCADDIEHIELAFQHINKLNEKQIQIIQDNFNQTCLMYSIFLSETTKVGLRYEAENCNITKNVLEATD